MTSDLESRALQGDVGAFGELIRAWDQDLRGVVWTVVHSAHATDDVMRSSYEQTFRNIARFDGQVPLKTLLHTVCLRGAIEHARSEPAGDRNGADGLASPATELGQAFDSLGRVDQMLLMLTTGLGYNFEQTATIAGIERGSVTSRVARARHQLRSRQPVADDLHEHLQNCIPAPGPGYWDDIDAQLGTAQGANVDRGLDELLDMETGPSTPVVRPSPLDEPDDLTKSAAGKPAAWFENKKLLAAAALIVIAVIGIFRLSNGSDDLIEAATAAQSADGTVASADNSATDGAGALTALQSRLAGTVEGTDIAGPFCFTAEGVFDFLPQDVGGVRDLFWIGVGPDGFANFYALQGTTVLVSGSGYPSASGVLVVEPAAEAGGVQLPPSYTIEITDADVSLVDVEDVLVATPCAQVQDRVDTIFALLQLQVTRATPSADWPPSDAVLSSAGLGPIRIGMTLSELSTELGTELAFDTFGVAQAGECGTVASSSAISNDVWILVELTSATDAVIRRVSVSGGLWTTPSGISVGVTEQTVIDTFPGQIQSEPHAFVDGTYLNFQNADVNDPNSVQFVNEGGTITEIHVGDRAWVGLVEGCA